MEEKWTRRVVALVVVGSALSRWFGDSLALSSVVQEIVILSAMIIGTMYLLWAMGQELWTIHQRRLNHRANRAHRRATQQEEACRALIRQLQNVRTEIEECEYDPEFGTRYVDDAWRTSDAMLILQHMLQEHGIPFPSPDDTPEVWEERLQELVVQAKVGKLGTIAGNSN